MKVVVVVVVVLVGGGGLCFTVHLHYPPPLPIFLSPIETKRPLPFVTHRWQPTVAAEAMLSMTVARHTSVSEVLLTQHRLQATALSLTHSSGG